MRTLPLRAEIRTLLVLRLALSALLRPLVATTAPDLVAARGVGADTAGARVVAAGDNLQRLRSEAASAHFRGVAPSDASSGLTGRKRLNRGGDRSAKRASRGSSWSAIAGEPRTLAYVARRPAEGRSKREIIRGLKRYVARDLYRCLPRVQPPA